MKKRTQGYLFALLAITIFAVQDGASKHLASAHSAIFITMLRYWAFAAFCLVLSSKLRGGIAETARTKAPVLQIARGALLAIEIVTAISCFALIGLARSQAIFAATPLLVTMLSYPILGERVGLPRWAAVLAGLIGVMIILRPSGNFFEFEVLLAVVTSLLFAIYIILTRKVSRLDSPMTSFFYTGVAGCAIISLIGPFYWTNMPAADWGWMGLVCLTSVSSHYFLIKAYNMLDAAAVQPLTYLSVVYGSLTGFFVFHEAIVATTIIGACLVVAAGIFSFWVERRTPAPVR